MHSLEPAAWSIIFVLTHVCPSFNRGCSPMPKQGLDLSSVLLCLLGDCWKRSIGEAKGQYDQQSRLSSVPQSRLSSVPQSRLSSVLRCVVKRKLVQRSIVMSLNWPPKAVLPITTNPHHPNGNCLGLDRIGVQECVAQSQDLQICVPTCLITLAPPCHQ